MPKAAAATARIFTSSVGVPHENRHTLIALLNQRLADAADLHSQVKWAHWNVKGSDFIQLHELFDAIATRLEDSIDSLAERVTTLGGIANGTHHANALRSAVKESDDLGDPITTDLFTQLTRELDKDLWFLEAHTRV